MYKSFLIDWCTSPYGHTIRVLTTLAYIRPSLGGPGEQVDAQKTNSICHHHTTSPNTSLATHRHASSRCTKQTLNLFADCARTSHCRCWPSSCAIRSSWSKRIFSSAPEWSDFLNQTCSRSSQMLQICVYCIQICSDVCSPHGLLPHAMALAASWVVPKCHLPAPDKDHAKSCRDARRQ